MVFKCLFSKLRLNIRNFGIVTVNVWYLAQILSIQLLKDVGTTISDSVTFHIPIRDDVYHDSLPTEVSPPPDVRVGPTIASSIFKRWRIKINSGKSLTDLLHGNFSTNIIQQEVYHEIEHPRQRRR